MPGCARLGRPRAAVPFYYGHDKKALSPAAQRGLNDHLDKQIHALDFLTFDERDDLLQFLDALNGKLPDNASPPLDLASAPKITGTSAK